MTSRGKVIALEGVDGAGKRTQSELLGSALKARGIVCAPFSFPRYESTFGRLIARFLNGDLGSLETIDAHFSALLYAGDRFEAKLELEEALAAGSAILADRYIASNLAHQTARVLPAQRSEFIAWLRHLEYGIYGLPAEDLVVYLRLPPTEAQQRVSRKALRKYTTMERDLQEADLHHLEQASAVYDLLAKEPNWVTVECIDPAADSPRTVQDIHRDVLAAVESLIFSSRSAG